MVGAGVLNRAVQRRTGLVRLSGVDDRGVDLDVQLPLITVEGERVVLAAGDGVAEAEVGASAIPVVTIRAAAVGRRGVDAQGVVADDDRAAAVTAEEAGLEHEPGYVASINVDAGLGVGDLTALPAGRGAGLACLGALDSVNRVVDGDGALCRVAFTIAPLGDLRDVVPVGTGHVDQAGVLFVTELARSGDERTDRLTDLLGPAFVAPDRAVDVDVVDVAHLFVVSVEGAVSRGEIAVVAATVVAVETDGTAPQEVVRAIARVAVATPEVLGRLELIVRVVLGLRLTDLDLSGAGRLGGGDVGLGRDVDRDVLAVDRGAGDTHTVGL